jgi:hypothetical protein
LLPKSSNFRGGEYGSKTVICQRGAMIPLGKWWRARARHPLESLVLIRICNRDPGPHILVKQRLVGAGNEPTPSAEIRVIAAATRFSVATVFFFGFGSPLLTVFKSFIPFGNFFT